MTDRGCLDYFVNTTMDEGAAGGGHHQRFQLNTPTIVSVGLDAGGDSHQQTPEDTAVVCVVTEVSDR